MIDYSFLNPGETIIYEKYDQKIDEMHWKLECVQPVIGQLKGPNSSPGQCSTTHCTTNASKAEWVVWSFASFTILTWLLPLLQASWQLFAGKILPQPTGGRKCFPRVHWILKHRFFCYRNKHTYFWLAKNVLIVIVPILMNKDVFVPSYGKLKFTVQPNILIKYMWLLFNGTGMKTDLFQSCGHCWDFQICWDIECSTFTASSFKIWNSSTRIPSHPLALFLVMLSKAHLTSHSRMSGSRWVITPLWLSGSWRSFLYNSSMYSCHLFLISSASVRSIPFLSFTEPIFAWMFPWYL